jgi:hypothetical protein
MPAKYPAEIGNKNDQLSFDFSSKDNDTTKRQLASVVDFRQYSEKYAQEKSIRAYEVKPSIAKYLAHASKLKW